MKLKELLLKLILPLKGGGKVDLRPYSKIVKNIDIDVDDGGGDEPTPEPETKVVNVDFSCFNSENLFYNKDYKLENFINPNDRKSNYSQQIFLPGKIISDYPNFQFYEQGFNNEDITYDNTVDRFGITGDTWNYPKFGFNNFEEVKILLNKLLILIMILKKELLNL